MHAKDELYQSLRGPAKNFTVLAHRAGRSPKPAAAVNTSRCSWRLTTAKAVFFTPPWAMIVEALKCVGFIVTLQRGTEWAATGKVTQTKIPDDFPTADKVKTRN